MPRNLWAMARMVLGSVLGTIGFATVSLGFVHLTPAGLALGLVEILLAAFIVLGVMVPLRKNRANQ